MRRGLMHWNPFVELERIRREFDRLLEEFTPTVAMEKVFSPAVEVYETDKEVVVKVELPGIKKEDVELSIKDNALHIRGEKKEEREEKTESVHLVERIYGKFERVINIPKDVKLEDIKAEYKDGVLEVKLPKAETARETKIQIK